MIRNSGLLFGPPVEAMRRKSAPMKQSLLTDRHRNRAILH